MFDAEMYHIGLHIALHAGLKLTTSLYQASLRTD